ncbi:response regulator transcription factor [Streptomyces sp. NBC_01537]|uniref:response regulator transcription factor n=1 Tax=Streptomyces sp. NBC_01537 TaxID=2903896 RepID=UPI0038682708
MTMTMTEPTTTPGASGAPRILVVDDERAIRDALHMILSRRGYEVLLACDGEEALEMVESARPDLVILDVLLPFMDGLTACRRLRARGDEVPVMMLTARDTIGDRVTGLETGADDYLAKPFATDELVARIRALLRRRQRESALVHDTVFSFAGLRMDTVGRDVTRDGRDLRLTRTEFALLELFMARPRQVLERDRLLKALWGDHGLPTANTLDVYVMYLRRKTEAGGLSRLIRTVRGVGYVLDTDLEAVA